MDARIDRLQRIAADSPDVLALGGGLPSDELLPRAEIAAAFFAALGERRCAALQYGWPEGDRELRAWIAARLAARGADVDADDVIVTNGAQQAISIATEVLVARGARVCVDPESYPAALDLFRARGARLATSADGAACAYAMPGVANPRGDGMSASRGAALLACGAPIVADEAYTELRFDGAVPRPMIADARDRTWHVGTFSKTLCPGLRVGWLVPPPAERDRALRVKHDRDLQCASLAQAIVRAFVARDDFDARLARSRAFYEARALRLARALRRELPSWRFREPEGGFSIYVETDMEGDDARFLAIAARHGVAFDPGSMFRVDEASSPIALRVCFSSVDASALDDAARRLARAARAFTKDRAPPPTTRPT